MTDPIPANLLVQTVACDERLQKLQIKAFATTGQDMTGEVILAVREVVAMVETLEKSRTLPSPAPAGPAEVMGDVAEIARVLKGGLEFSKIPDDAAVLRASVDWMCLQPVLGGPVRDLAPEDLRRPITARDLRALCDSAALQESTGLELARVRGDVLKCQRVIDAFHLALHEAGVTTYANPADAIGQLQQQLAEARGELERLKAATPAAPCATVDDLLRRVSTVEHCGEDHVALEDVRVLLGRALSRPAQQKQAEGATTNPVRIAEVVLEEAVRRATSSGDESLTIDPAELFVAAMTALGCAPADEESGRS